MEAPAEGDDFYKELLAKDELMRSDTSIFPSYTNLTLPYEALEAEIGIEIKDIPHLACLQNLELIARSFLDIEKSYGQITNFGAIYPCYVVCRQRYKKAGWKHRAQFKKEIREQEALQARALDGVRLHKLFCNTILQYPKADELITLTTDEKWKLERILAT